MLEEDGCRVEDEDYFSCLGDHTVFLLLKDGEEWRPARADRGQCVCVCVCVPCVRVCACVLNPLFLHDNLCVCVCVCVCVLNPQFLHDNLCVEPPVSA